MADRVALVTGGTRGIGAAIVRRLSADGFTVAISGRTPESVKSGLDAFRKEGIAVVGQAANARREEDQKALVDFVGRQFGRLDVLVNNAGVGGFDSVDRLSPEDFRKTVETNLFGPYYAIHYAAPLMKKNGGGFIVNIGSLAGVNAFAGGSAYNASKFGLLGRRARLRIWFAIPIGRSPHGSSCVRRDRRKSSYQYSVVSCQFNHTISISID